MEEWEEPDNHPWWASVSPDGQTVVFAKQHDLWMMSAADYARILDARRGKEEEERDKAEEKVEVEEVQLTEDGEEHYSYAVRDYGDTDVKKEKNRAKRKRASIAWSNVFTSCHEIHESTKDRRPDFFLAGLRFAGEAHDSAGRQRQSFS